jgi:DNA-binding IclR family transcriptional regulator
MLNLMVAKSSMGRGMDVLFVLGSSTRMEPAGVTVKTLADALARDRSQVSRTLSGLSAVGLSERVESGYRLPASIYASAQALTQRRLLTDGLTVLEETSALTGEACFLGVLSGASTVTIAEAVPPQTGLLGSWVGRAYPAFCSDAGQATLWDADDEEIGFVLSSSDFTSGGPNAPADIEEFIARLRIARARGYSIIDEEAEPGLMSVAAPVFDYRAEVVAALQVVGVRESFAPRIGALGACCRDAADRLSARICGQRA